MCAVFLFFLDRHCFGSVWHCILEVFLKEIENFVFF